MSWLRIDDGFDEHLKIVDLSDAAFRAHVEGLTYCARNLTNGVIPAGVNGRICTKTVRQELVDAGVWEADGRAIRIHDYLDWNPSKEQVIADREMRTARAKKGAAASIEARRKRA